MGTGAHLDLLGVDDWRVTGFSPTSRSGRTGLRLRRRRLTLDDQRRDRHARRRSPRSPDIDVEVVQIATSRVLQNHVLHGAPVTVAGGVAFGPDGRALVSDRVLRTRINGRCLGRPYSSAAVQRCRRSGDRIRLRATLGATGRRHPEREGPVPRSPYWQAAPSLQAAAGNIDHISFRQPGAARRSPRPTTPSASGTCAPASASATRSVLTRDSSR